VKCYNQTLVILCLWSSKLLYPSTFEIRPLHRIPVFFISCTFRPCTSSSWAAAAENMPSSGNSPSQQRSKPSSSRRATGGPVKSKRLSTSTSTSQTSLLSSSSQQKTRSGHVLLALHDPNLDQVDLVIPGPEQPLVDGVESHFRKGKHNPR